MAKNDRLPTACIENWKVAVVATAHIPESFIEGEVSVMDKLAELKGDYGWMVRLGDLVPDNLNAWARETSEMVRSGFIDLLHFFEKDGFTHVLFDTDGAELSQFPIFDW